MSETPLSEKTEDQLLEEAEALVQRMGVLASYIDALVWNIRKLLELLLAIDCLRRGTKIPQDATVQSLLQGHRLSKAVLHDVNWLGGHGSLGVHAQKTDITEELAPPSQYVGSIGRVARAILANRPDDRDRICSALKELESAIDSGERGPNVDWVERVANADRARLKTGADLRAAEDRLRIYRRDAETRERNLEQQLEAARIEAEARLTKVQAELALSDEARKRADDQVALLAASRSEHQARAHDLEAKAARLERLQIQTKREADAARRDAGAAREEARAAESQRQSLERDIARLQESVATHVKPAEPRDSASASKHGGRRTVIFAALLGSVIAAVAWLVSKSGAHEQPPAPASAPNAFPSTEAPSAATSSAPSIALSTNSPGASSATAAPRARVLSIKGLYTTWHLTIPKEWPDATGSETRQEVLAGVGLRVRFHACRSESWQNHRKTGKTIWGPDNIAFGLYGSEGSQVFTERCLYGQDAVPGGKQDGAHICVRVLHERTQDAEASALLEKLGNPERD